MDGIKKHMTSDDIKMSEFTSFMNRESEMADDPYERMAIENVATSLQRFAYFKRTDQHPPMKKNAKSDNQ